jgi:hypothetical protein
MTTAKRGHGRLTAAPVALALLLGAAVLGQPAAAQSPAPGSPVPLDELSLAQPGVIQSFGAWTSSDSSVCHATAGTSRTGSAVLAGGSSGALLDLTFPDQTATPELSVLQAEAGQLELEWSADVGSGSSASHNSWEMSGIGSQFAGTVTVTFAANGCSVTEDDTLTLAGTGLTLVAASPSTTASPSPASGPAIPTPEAGAPAWFLQGCYQGETDDPQNVQSSATDLLGAGQATVTLDVGQAGTLGGTLAFDGSGSNGSAIAYRPGVVPITLLDSGDGPPAYSCSDPCVVAFDGSGSSGSAIGYHPEDGPPALLADSGTGCDLSFDGGTGSGSAIAHRPGGASSPSLDAVRLPAISLTATSPTPVPVGTEVATGRASHSSSGNHTLALPLTAAGRSLLEQVKTEDAAYWAANPSGTSPPYALMTLTLTFTPAASATGGLSIAVWLVPLVVIVIAVIAVVLWRRRRSRLAPV